VTRQPKSISGFTLVEVLVSFAILSMTIIAGFQIFGEGLSRVSRVEKALDETAAAKQMLSLPLTANVTPTSSKEGLVKQSLTETLPDWTLAHPILLRAPSRGQGNELETIVIEGAEQ
jgi:type II secretory pathway pseudopilin PulG